MPSQKRTEGRRRAAGTHPDDLGPGDYCPARWGRGGWHVCTPAGELGWLPDGVVCEHSGGGAVSVDVEIRPLRGGRTWTLTEGAWEDVTLG